MRLLLVDDHALFRRGLELLLNEIQPGLQLAHCGTRQALETALESRDAAAFDLIFLDLHLPGFFGLQSLEYVRQHLPATPVVVVSGEEQSGVIQACLEAGAAGFVSKSAPAANQADALEHWLMVFNTSVGDSPAPLSASNGSTHGPMAPGVPVAVPHLTERQKDVLRLTVHGKTNKMIARELGISDGTVKTHLTNIMSLFAVNTRTQLVFEMARNGWRMDGVY